MENQSWFKPKPYLHFSSLLYKKDLSWFYSKVKNPNWITSHAFFPLIHKEIITRRFRNKTKVYDLSKGLDSQGFIQSSIERQKLPLKVRPICYCTHIDAHIYAYYSKILSDLYENTLTEDLKKCVIGYRKIPRNNSKGNKSNIEFAMEVFS